MLRRTPPVAYNHCPDCGLTVPLRALYLALDVCPRCLARRRVARPMILSADGPAAGLERDRTPAGLERERTPAGDVQAAA